MGKDRWRERGKKRWGRGSRWNKEETENDKIRKKITGKQPARLLLVPHPKLTLGHPQQQTTFRYFKKKGQIAAVFLCFSFLLPHSIRTNGKQVDGNSSLRLLFIELEPKAGDCNPLTPHTRPHTRKHTHCSLQ